MFKNEFEKLKLLQKRVDRLQERFDELCRADHIENIDTYPREQFERYLRDRKSVRPEWLEVIEEYSELLRKFSRFTDADNSMAIKPKDDEAFRLFRESDIDFDTPL